MPFKLDRAGNIVARLSGRRARVPVVLVAHMDHPGFDVDRVEPDGKIRLRVLGGVGGQLNGRRVRFITRPDATGVIVKTAQTDAHGKITHVWARTSRPVPVSTYAMWDLPPCHRRGTKIFARAIDDVMGVAVMLEVLERLRKKKKAAFDLYACFTRAEEVGFVGAAALSRSGLIPKNAAVISIEMSRMLPRISVQGRGFVVRLGDRATVFDPGISQWMLETARSMQNSRADFRFQSAVLSGGVCEATLFNAMGYRSSGVALPLGNYHNRTPRQGVGPEYIDTRDLNCLVDFLSELSLRSAELKLSRTNLKPRLTRNFNLWKKYL